jgi:TolB-like protein
MDIMTALVKISGLLPISEGSMYSYKSKPVTVSELGSQLAVGYALESGVRKADNRVRVTSKLIEMSNSRRVWAERFDRWLDNLFAVPDEIIEKIATTLDIELVNGESAQRVRQTLRNPAALESYYRGRRTK